MRTLILVSLVLLTACSSRVKNLKTAEGTIEEAKHLLEDEFHDEARIQLNRIKSEFPQSPLQAEADLLIADSYYQEDSWESAAQMYELFVRTYPGRKEVPYAIYRTGKAYSEMTPGHPQRDSRSAEKAVDSYTRLLIDFPNSEYQEEATTAVKKAQDHLALKALAVAEFYERQNKPYAAAIRYGQLVDLFPDHPLAERALARQIVNLNRAGKNEEAAALKATFEQQFPNSEFKSMLRP